jgi:hypothetical protein
MEIIKEKLMSTKKPKKTAIEELNVKVHDLIYVEVGGKAKIENKTDIERGKELAKKIKENIAAYQDEATNSSKPSIQTS